MYPILAFINLIPQILEAKKPIVARWQWKNWWNGCLQTRHSCQNVVATILMDGQLKLHLFYDKFLRSSHDRTHLYTQQTGGHRPKISWGGTSNVSTLMPASALHCSCSTLSSPHYFHFLSVPLLLFTSGEWKEKHWGEMGG